MQEKRRAKRLPITLQLEISQLFKQDNVKVLDVDAPIEVTDISKFGVGFRSKSVLPLDYYFNAKMSVEDEEHILYCVVKIIRIDSDGETNLYGCEFVGMAPIFNYIFEEYENKMSE